MRAVLQRVLESRVEVDGRVVGAIGKGATVLLGVGQGDGADEVAWMAEKIANLRVFEDDEGKMNRSLLDVGGAVLAVSQFTLYGDCRKGRRPGFSDAAPPEVAQPLYKAFCTRLREAGLQVEEGIFQASMKVHILNDGPVTLLLDSRRGF